MKKTYINLMGIAFNALLCLSLALPAGAQNRGGSGSTGGGGGGSRPASSGGGGAVSAPRPSYNGGGGQRTGSSVPQRSATTQRTTTTTTQRTTAVAQTPRQGIAPGQRGVSATVQIGLAARPASSGLVTSNGVTRITAGRPYAGYYNAHGYYNSFYAPHLGFRLNVLPYGYYPFYWGGYPYFYSDGLYYQYQDNQYAVVEPPVGAAINVLPDNSQSIVINGIQYYELNGVYYQPITKDDGSVVYQVAGKDGELNTDDATNAPAAVAPPQIGDIITTLPQGTRTIRINGQKIYVSPDDYYYQDARDNNNNAVYKIVGTPSSEPNQ